MSLTLDNAETAALQSYLVSEGIDLGSYGPRRDGVDADGGKLTRQGFHEIFEKHFRPEFQPAGEAKPKPGAPNPFPKDNQTQLLSYFGEPGLHQTMLVLPYPMRLSWDLKTILPRFSCHEKVHDSLSAIFTQTLDHYGLEKIKTLGLDRFGGCLNVRKKRGGTTWSTHAWGAAVDLWPERNGMSWDHTEAEFARPAYLPFWEIVEAAGWTSLGRARDFDWMHFQAPHL